MLEVRAQPVHFNLGAQRACWELPLRDIFWDSLTFVGGSCSVFQKAGSVTPRPAGPTAEKRFWQKNARRAFSIDRHNESSAAHLCAGSTFVAYFRVRSQRELRS